MCQIFVLTVLFVLFPKNVSAGIYNWTYPIAPRQCSNLTITVAGDIFFPLKALIVPIGPSPLNYEVRKVIEVPFGTNATSVSFLLPYPTGSKFDGFVSPIFIFVSFMNHSTLSQGNRRYRLHTRQHRNNMDSPLIRRLILLRLNQTCLFFLQLLPLSTRSRRMSISRYILELIYRSRVIWSLFVRYLLTHSFQHTLLHRPSPR